MNRVFTSILFILSVSFSFSQNNDAALAKRINGLVEKNLPAGSNVGILAYDLTDNQVIYNYQADKLCRPASTMKLLTAISNLFLTPYDTPFRTEVWSVGEKKGKVLYGDIYVVGGYDPEFNEDSMDKIADQIQNTGIKEIRGHLKGDISMKDSLFFGDGWIWNDNPDDYQPYLSPLMYCKGIVKVEATPASAGQPADIHCIPQSSYYQINNKTLSNVSGEGRFKVTRNWLQDSYGIHSDGSNNFITVSGNVSRKQIGTVNVYRSEDFFMCALTEKLKERGIEIKGKSTDYIYEQLPVDTTNKQLIASLETPFQTVMNQQLKESDNLNAEALLCRLGFITSGHRHISVDEGITAIKSIIKKIGIDENGYRIADGSGLSGYTYLSPELEVAFLRYVYADKTRLAHLMEALPIGGVDGTLSNRMRKGTLSYNNVHAKTGTVTGVSCLAGFLTQSNGHEICFSIMNQNSLSSAAARAFQDKVCDVLIEN